jgi:hypothetical protein
LIRPILSPLDLALMGAVKPSRDAAFQLTQRCMPVRSVWGKVPGGGGAAYHLMYWSLAHAA